MGMRFMQRKGIQQPQQTPKESHSSFSRQPETSNASASNTFPSNGQINPSSTSLTCEEEIKSHKQTHEKDSQDVHHPSPHIPIVASTSDMYGISAKIIGRRSFNNFHKVVEETWLAAVKSMSSHSECDDDVEKQQITDEELLKRYEKYVKGRGDMVNKKEKSIGNLNRHKRKRET
jgi:hypothetical protein